MLLPVRDGSNERFGSSDEERLSEETNSEGEGSSMSEDSSRDDGGYDEDWEEESESKFGTSLVSRIMSGRSEGAVKIDNGGSRRSQRWFESTRESSKRRERTRTHFASRSTKSAKSPNAS